MSDPITEKPADFLASKVVPDAPTRPALPPRQRSRSTFRYLLPAAVFVAVVAAIAWVTQFMPNWRVKSSQQSSPPDNSSAAKVIGFVMKKAVWDPEDETYALET